MGTVSPIDFAAYVIIEIYPDTKKITKDEDINEFPGLMPILLSLLGRVKGHNYSKEALLSLVKEEYLKGLSVFDLMVLIGNTAFCSFPVEEGDPMFFKSVSQNPPQLRTDYGDEPYINSFSDAPPPIKKTPLTMESPRIATAVTRVLSRADLTVDPSIVELKRKYRELEKPNTKYYWQWRVSTEDYLEYQNCLKAIDFSDRTREKVRLCAPQLSFYIAEWYKREYDGFNSVSCLGDVGLNSGYSKEIWEGSHSDGDIPYRTTDTDRNEWLYSTYVLGGFPIKYTKRANRLAFLFEEMWGEDREQDSISEEQLNELTQGFDGNQVVKNSLISGSLHEYYRYLLLEETMPIADSDKDKDPFTDFIRNLQEGKKYYYENFIKPVWYLYVDPHDSIVSADIQIVFGRKGDRCYIPCECLRFWGVPNVDSLTHFEIAVSNLYTGVENCVHFSKASPGDYPFVGWTRYNRITMPVSYDTAERITISIRASGVEIEIGKAISTEDSIQFYKTARPYEWSSRVDNGTHTAVLFNPAKLSLIDNSSEVSDKLFSEGGKVWKWIPLTEEIVLSSDGDETITYAPHNSRLDVQFKLLQGVIKYNSFRDIVYFRRVDDEVLQTPVPLLKDNGFSVKFTPYGTDRAVTISPNRCKVQFKRVEDARFIDWDTQTHPEQGLLQIRIIYPEGNISTRKLVYYLPNTQPIIRHVHDNRIVFGKELRDVYAPSADGYYPLQRNAEGNYEYTDNLVSGYNPYSDTIPFVLGIPDKEYAVINVYRSAICKELYLKTREAPIKRYDGSRGFVEVPFILKDSFEIRSINEDGVTRARCGQDLYMGFDYSLGNRITDSENELRYYMFKDRGFTSNDLNKVQLETTPEQYRFYYWSMSTGEDPFPLEQSFDPSTKILTIDTTFFNKNKHGIIFQSLKDLHPRHYFMPILGNQRMRYGASSRVRCYDVAAEHGIPFQVFPNLKDIFTNSDPMFFLTGFLQELMKEHRWSLSAQDYKNLHRFADEFLFDWLMIPHQLWKNKLIKDAGWTLHQEIPRALFRTSPHIRNEEKGYLEKVLELYWDLPPSSQWNFRRSSRPENILMQSMRHVKGDYSGFNLDFEDRIKKLQYLRSSNNLYEGMYKMMAQLLNNTHYSLYGFC